ncbi:hypothetical protein M569_13435, partial [Genlisea aurea]
AMSFSVRVRRRLPDFLQSVKLKYVKLGYHYLLTHGLYLFLVPLFLLIAIPGAEELRRIILDGAGDYHHVTNVVLALSALVFSAYVYLASRPCPVYLLDFACYRPTDDCKVSKKEFIHLASKSGGFDDDSLEFQRRILESSGLGDETYLRKSIFALETTATTEEGRAEASAVIFGALDELFETTRIRPSDVGILIVSCSIFNPTPSLSAFIINHYKIRGNILSFTLGGMGCSASIVALDLALDLLQSNPNRYAVVVSTEMAAYNFYRGKERSMLIPNCYFRMGCSAVLLSNHRRDRRRAKYSLEHIVRTHKGSEDRSFRSTQQTHDKERVKGLRMSKDLMEIGGEALKTNITTLSPLVLPISEQLLFFSSLIREFFSGKGTDSSSFNLYIPDYKLAFEHFCLHAPSKSVLDELQRNLNLTNNNMEPSRAVLHRFGNLSSSSIWYQLAYLEGKARVKKGDRVWQLAFGSGFKCNSAVWRAMKTTMSEQGKRGPWFASIDMYPQ